MTGTLCTLKEEIFIFNQFKKTFSQFFCPVKQKLMLHVYLNALDQSMYENNMTHLKYPNTIVKNNITQ